MRRLKLALAILATGLVLQTGLSAQSWKEYGCGLNPKKSLTVKAGTSATISTNLVLQLDNPLKTQGCSTFTFLFIDDKPHSSFPCGLKLPGWSMANVPPAPGEILFSPFDGYVLFPGPVWGCKPGPVSMSLPIPPILSLIDNKFYAQGLMFDPSSKVGFGLTNGLELSVGPSPVSKGFGANISSHLNPKSEREIYDIRANAGDQLIIPFRRTTGGNFSVTIDLHDSNWNKLDTVTGGGGTFRPKPLPATGTYHVVVRTTSGLTGYYHMSIQRTKNPGAVRALKIGNSIRGHVTPTYTAIDVYKFSALEKDRLFIPYRRATGGSFTLQFDLYDTNGKLLAQTKPGGSGVFTPPPIPKDGEYYLWIRNPDVNATGYYHFDLQRTVNPGGVKPLKIGNSIRGHLTPTFSAIDVYKFSALANDSLVIPFVRATGGSFTLQLYLYDANGNRLSETKAASGGVFTPPPIPKDGDYYLWFRNPSINATGYYHFDLQRTVNPGGVKALKIGDSIRGHLTPTFTRIDVYKLSARANDNLFIPFVRATSGSFTLQFDLYDANGKRLTQTKKANGGIFTPPPIPKDRRLLPLGQKPRHQRNWLLPLRRAADDGVRLRAQDHPRIRESERAPHTDVHEDRRLSSRCPQPDPVHVEIRANDGR